MAPIAQLPSSLGSSQTLPVTSMTAPSGSSLTPPRSLCHMPSSLGLSSSLPAPPMPIPESEGSSLTHPRPNMPSSPAAMVGSTSDRRRRRERKRGRGHATSADALSLRSALPPPASLSDDSGQAQAQPATGRPSQQASPPLPPSARSLTASSGNVIAEPSDVSYPFISPSLSPAVPQCMAP